ncbi:hypothetical protein L484_016816 [Morus notabilis]|uniref:Uncharacterized protein n=1 Tax=Morus notabilis TaxID=981085 RepID=W9SF25_9ROSA|nr:hypothetical protein L484_016816 [Morus notabilis]
MSESSEIVTKETDPKEPRNVFALFAKFKLPLPFLKPKDGPVAEDGPREPVVSDGGTESRKVDFVRIPKAQVAVPPPVAVENEEANKTSNPIILWQVCIFPRRSNFLDNIGDLWLVDNAGLELTDNKVQERLKKWAEDEAQEGGAHGDAEAQEGRAQGKTTGFKGRFEKRGNIRAKSSKGILEEGFGVECGARARRTPGWLDGFELKGKR